MQCVVFVHRTVTTSTDMNAPIREIKVPVIHLVSLLDYVPFLSFSEIHQVVFVFVDLIGMFGGEWKLAKFTAF